MSARVRGDFRRGRFDDMQPVAPNDARTEKKHGPPQGVVAVHAEAVRHKHQARDTIRCRTFVI